MHVAEVKSVFVLFTPWWSRPLLLCLMSKAALPPHSFLHTHTRAHMCTHKHTTQYSHNNTHTHTHTHTHTCTPGSITQSAASSVSRSIVWIRIWHRRGSIRQMDVTVTRPEELGKRCMLGAWQPTQHITPRLMLYHFSYPRTFTATHSVSSTR